MRSTHYLASWHQALFEAGCRSCGASIAVRICLTQSKIRALVFSFFWGGGVAEQFLCGSSISFVVTFVF